MDFSVFHFCIQKMCLIIVFLCLSLKIQNKVTQCRVSNIIPVFQDFQLRLKNNQILKKIILNSLLEKILLFT